MTVGGKLAEPVSNSAASNNQERFGKRKPIERFLPMRVAATLLNHTRELFPRMRDSPGRETARFARTRVRIRYISSESPQRVPPSLLAQTLPEPVAL